jgi:hypothetical protein
MLFPTVCGLDEISHKGVRTVNSISGISFELCSQDRSTYCNLHKRSDCSFACIDLVTTDK